MLDETIDGDQEAESTEESSQEWYVEKLQLAKKILRNRAKYNFNIFFSN